MSYTPISQVNVTLQSTGITGQGFGVPLFATSHLRSFNKVEAITSASAAATLFGSDSNAFKAVNQFFSSTPSPSLVKIARRDADATITVPAISTFLSLTYKTRPSVGGQVTTNQLNINGTDGTDVATQLETQLTSDSNLTGVISVTRSANEVTLTVIQKDLFHIVSSSVPETYSNPTESASQLLTNIELADPDFYFFTCEDKSESFVTQVIFALSGSETPRQYFVSVSNTAELSNSGFLGLYNDQDRLVSLWHQDAETTFPECAFVGYNAPYQPGSVTWGNLRIGLAPSRNAGALLTPTEKGNLKQNNVSFIDNIGGIGVLRGGLVANGEAIETIRGRDALTNDLNVSLTNLLINQQGGKIPYTNAGVSQIISTVRSVLDIYVDRTFINEGYTLDFLPVERVPNVDKQNRVYQSGSFEAELSGAILETSIQGNLAISL